jgi:hypothetical protein
MLPAAKSLLPKVGKTVGTRAHHGRKAPAQRCQRTLEQMLHPWGHCPRPNRMTSKQCMPNDPCATCNLQAHDEHGVKVENIPFRDMAAATLVDHLLR